MASKTDRLPPLEGQGTGDAAVPARTTSAAPEATVDTSMTGGTFAGDLTPVALPEPRTVKIKLHRGRTEAESGDVFVSVNGRRFQIQRGVEVEVPEYVAEVLNNSERQDMAAARRRDLLKQGMQKAANE